MVRTDSDIQSLIDELKELHNTVKLNPEKLIKLTGGNIPPIVSNIQIMWTMDTAALGINLLKWCLGEENGALQVAMNMNQKLKEG
jgi:hypothetical protein